MAAVWGAMAQLRNGTAASGLTARSDGMTYCLDGNRIVVYGGDVGGKVWVLDLGRREWTEVFCSGTPPPPRVHHSACVYGGHMLVYGGETQEPEDWVPYFELDLSTWEWMRVPTQGDHPGVRSHHTATIHDGRMYVIGGRRPGRQTDRELHEDKLAGFYDVHVLNVLSQQWTRIERADPLAPMLWGHSCAAFRHFLLCFGGFDVSGTDQDTGLVGPPTGGEGPPTALLSDSVRIYDMTTGAWKKASPRGTGPRPRAMHCAVAHGRDMIVFGGMTIDSNGRPLNVNDAWLWDVGDGLWTPLEFCVPYWPSRRLIHAVHQGRLLVSHELTTLYSLDFADKASGWQASALDPAPLFAPRPQRPPPPLRPPASPPDTP
eukprot:Hpha_TRINITY_DN3956_c0_g1::TRINITY_DN3956_c0_g1_i1::g.18092::m.18092